LLSQNSFVVKATSFVLDGLYSGLPAANRGWRATDKP